MKKLLGNVGVLILTVTFFLAVVELGLRLSGFSYVLYPEEIEFGKPDPVLMKTGFLEDDDLFWVTRDYPEKLARFRRERPEIVLLGDSCTQFGTYDRELARIVRERRGRQLAYANLGVAGWTSHQGRRQLERDVVGLEPRVVTIYYGWNDHWIGFGVNDKSVSRIKRVFSSRWSGLRTVQLATRAAVAISSRGSAWPKRVALEDFRSNLRRMAEVARGAGIRPMFLTAPTSIRPGEEPDYLTERWLEDLSELLPLHHAYADAARAVAGDDGIALCDLERRFSELPPEELKASFLADGIHFTEEGSRRTAEILYECLEREGMLDPAL